MSYSYVFKYIIIGDTGKNELMKVSVKVVFCFNLLTTDSVSNINLPLESSSEPRPSKLKDSILNYKSGTL